MPKKKIMTAIAKRGFYRTALVRGRGLEHECARPEKE
jgi:hypothetical protein